MLIHFVNRFLLNFSVFCCFFMYVCIIHDTFYFVNNSNCYYFMLCFSCSIIHYPIVGDEPFFIWMAEIIFGADPDPFKYFLQFFCCCRELYPFTDQCTLVVFQIVIWFWTTKKRHTHHRYGNELTLYFESIFFCKRKQTRDCCCVLCLICL